MRKLPVGDPMDKGFGRVGYCRYADDFVIFVCGSKAETLQIRDEIASFLTEKLHLQLNMEKTKITNLRTEDARFLGFDIHRLRPVQKGTKVNKRSNGRLCLRMPKEVVNSKIREFTVNGKPVSRDDRLNSSVEEDIRMWNSEIVGLYNYYAPATNVSKEMWRFKWYHMGSLLHTIAKKEKISIRKVKEKYGVQTQRKDGHGMKLAIGIERGADPPLLYYDGSFVQKKIFPETRQEEPGEFGKELKERLLNNTCEVCGSHQDIEVHHVRNLDKTVKHYRNKNTVPDWVRLMDNMNRKTLVLCCSCHKALHKGRLRISEERLGSGLHRNVHDPF